MLIKLMFMKICLLLYFLLPSVIYADNIYKVIDNENNVIFTDRPTNKAKKIELKEASSISPPKPISYPKKITKNTNDAFKYTRLSIIEPKNNETIYNNQGDVTIKFLSEPKIRDTDKIILSIDNKDYVSAEQQYDLHNVDRGTHTIKAVLIGENKEKLISSDTIVFYMRRIINLSPEMRPNPNVESPLNPPRPKPFEISPTSPPKYKPTK